MASDKEARRVVIDLANLQPVDTAMQGFREKYDLKGELAASEFPKELGKQHNLLNPDGRTLFLRDLAQRLWSGGGDERGVELLEEFLFAVNEGHVPVVSVRMGPVARAVPDRVRIDWRRQALAYQPQTKLQSAFYYLLRHSNLARVCANP